MRGAARSLSRCSTDGRGARDSCSLSLYIRSCYVRRLEHYSSCRAAAFLFHPLLHSQERCRLGRRSLAPLPTGDDGLFFSFSCQGTTQCPSFGRSRTKGSSWSSLLQVQTLFVARSGWPTSPFRVTRSAISLYGESGVEGGRKEGPRPLQ